jgi:hypothetical protein
MNGIIRLDQLTIFVAESLAHLDAFRKKRNVSNYDIGSGISDRGVQEMIALAV